MHMSESACRIDSHLEKTAALACHVLQTLFIRRNQLRGEKRSEAEAVERKTHQFLVRLSRLAEGALARFVEVENVGAELRQALTQHEMLANRILPDKHSL